MIESPSKEKRKKYADWAEEYPDHLILLHSGFFYMSWGRAAEVLNEILDYTLAYTKKGNIPYTGGTSLEIIENALKSNQINYIVVEKGRIVEKRDYEYCTETFYREDDFRNSVSAKQDRVTDEDKLYFIDALLNGIDPVTGEVLDEDHIVYDDTFKAVLKTAQNAINKKQERERNKKPAAGARWTAGEDEQLIEEYNSKLPISRIAELHGRSTVSIQSRLLKLAIIPLEQNE